MEVGWSWDGCRGVPHVSLHRITQSPYFKPASITTLHHTPTPRKHEFRCFNTIATTTTSLASKSEPEVEFPGVLTSLPPPPSPSNASQRWFRCHYHHLHLPRVQMRAGGGLFGRFDVSGINTTSLALKHELEVVSTSLPPSPPPSRPNASWRWSFRAF
jgi:hypothetical protein